MFAVYRLRGLNRETDAAPMRGRPLTASLLVAAAATAALVACGGGDNVGGRHR